MPRKNVFSQKGGEPTVRKMMVSVPEELYKQLRHRSVETDTTMSEIVAQALQAFLSGKKGGETGKK